MPNDQKSLERNLSDAAQEAFERTLSAPRNLVLSKVQAGEMTPDDAEDWARRTGEQPFAGEPALTEFDPMVEADWTLAMATAWIIWRTPEAVRRVWEPFQKECTRWEWFEVKLPKPYRPDGYKIVSGHKLVQPAIQAPYDVILSAVTWAAMAEAEIKIKARGEAAPDWRISSQVVAAEAAELKLRSSLRAGYPLIARHGTVAEPINCHVWGALSPFDDGRGGCEDVHDHNGIVQFHRVRVERNAVLEVWPAISEAIIAINSTIREEKQCKLLILEMMKRSPLKATTTKIDLKVNHFPRLSSKAIARAWAAAVTEANAPIWSKGGRRRKSPPQ